MIIIFFLVLACIFAGTTSLWYCTTQRKLGRLAPTDNSYTPACDIIFETKEIDIGVTVVQLIFADGSTFDTKIYGNTYVYYDSQRLTENSKEVASRFIRHFPNIETTYVNDNNNPTESKMGKVINAKIKATTSFVKKVQIQKKVSKS